MPKKWTEEERKAFGEKMRAAKAKKQQTINPGLNDEPQNTIQTDPEIEALKRQIEELKSLIQPQQLQQPTIGAQGMVGTLEKYSTAKGYYPDPRERLAQEPRLTRFAFGENFMLDFEVGASSYRTIDNVQTKEPKFTLRLIRRRYDEDTGEPMTDKDGKPIGYVISNLVFHEDPETAIYIARENDVDIDAYGERQFLNEMRYLRMRDWLLDCFYPPKPPENKFINEEVIGNKLVQVITINAEADAEQPQINFHGLKRL